MLVKRFGTSAGSPCRSARHAAPVQVRPSVHKLVVLNVATLQRADNTLSNIMAAQLTPALSTGEDFRICTNIDTTQIPAGLRKDCVLFYTPDTEELAQKVANQAGGTITLGRIKWK